MNNKENTMSIKELNQAALEVNIKIREIVKNDSIIKLLIDFITERENIANESNLSIEGKEFLTEKIDRIEKVFLDMDINNDFRISELKKIREEIYLDSRIVRAYEIKAIYLIQYLDSLSMNKKAQGFDLKNYRNEKVHQLISNFKHIVDFLVSDKEMDVYEKDEILKSMTSEIILCLPMRVSRAKFIDNMRAMFEELFNSFETNWVNKFITNYSMFYKYEDIKGYGEGFKGIYDGLDEIRNADYSNYSFEEFENPIQNCDKIIEEIIEMYAKLIQIGFSSNLAISATLIEDASHTKEVEELLSEYRKLNKTDNEEKNSYLERLENFDRVHMNNWWNEGYEIKDALLDAFYENEFSEDEESEFLGILDNNLKYYNDEEFVSEEMLNVSKGVKPDESTIKEKVDAVIGDMENKFSEMDTKNRKLVMRTLLANSNFKNLNIFQYIESSFIEGAANKGAMGISMNILEAIIRKYENLINTNAAHMNHNHDHHHNHNHSKNGDNACGCGCGCH